MTLDQNTKHSAASAVSRAEALTQLLAEAPEPGDIDDVRVQLNALSDEGAHILFCHPGTKMPADLRGSGQRRAADKAAQEAARAAGDVGWQRRKASRGVHLATDDPAHLSGFLDAHVEAHGSQTPTNIAVAVGPSRIVVVDCDTAEQAAAFRATAGLTEDASPTVRTPGARDEHGGWVHRDGGHWWFVVPEDVELPGAAGSLTDPEGKYAVMWSGSYVLMPPSVRPEGRYETAGKVEMLPHWLHERISAHGSARAARADRAFDANSPTADRIEQWGASVTWAEILEPLGWTERPRPESCGCPTFTAPGAHASPKSAVGHERGCTLCRDSIDPPLHLWTDHDVEPFERLYAKGKTTITRLDAVAAGYYDHQIGAAMTDQDLHDDSNVLTLPGSLHGKITPPAAQIAGKPSLRGRADTRLPEEFWAARPALAHIRAAAHSGVNSADAVLGVVLARLSASVDPVVRVRTGVKSPLPLNTFVGVVGSSGTGKSSAATEAENLINAAPVDPLDSRLIAGGRALKEMPVGTGPGVAEAFMGPDPDRLAAKSARCQVVHNLLMQCDEGASLVAGIIDNKRGQDIGPTLRSAWSGKLLGQGNASVERRREVRVYSVGLEVGFQLEAIAALSTPEQMEYGTPQRFLFVSATDPSIPDVAPVHPGPLAVTLPAEPLTYDDELCEWVRSAALARARGEVDGGNADPMQAQRPATVARLAALLVILCDPGRTVVHRDDVELAEMLMSTSAAIHTTALEWRRDRVEAEEERLTEKRISEQVAGALALDGRADELTRVRTRILRYLAEADGPALWNGTEGLRKRKFKANLRRIADTALEGLEDEGAVERNADGLVKLTPAGGSLATPSAG
ncbi:bifunctional DNA primase/polymerase [Williamsia herbipolensis]|uniref:bifunctional DNA primase/polymerase n=1 Tax=Williamsia herbipolensis TaxID=1603258 RepID=UPI00069618C2|nr:bifunctional DNA primase/polymerase [Williamsia herbipolensis]